MTRTTPDRRESPHWAKILCARFGRPYEADWDAWEMVFGAELSNWTSAEIATVLAWMQSQGQSWTKPATAQDLIIAVRTHRKQDREQNELPQLAAECGLCNGTGWLDHYDEFAAGWTADDFSTHGVTQVPCACSGGQRWLSLCEDYQDGALRNRVERMRPEAVKHNQARAYAVTGSYGVTRRAEPLGVDGAEALG